MTNDEFDTIIDYARVLERYEDPRLRPLSKENFLIYDNARRALAHLRKTCTADSADVAHSKAIDSLLDDCATVFGGPP